MFKPGLTTEEKNKRQNIFLSLPKDLRTAILSEETADKLYNISYGKYKLGPEQQRIISFTTGEVLLGIIKLNELIKTLTKRLEIDSAIAEKQARDIKEAIFQPVINTLNKVLEESSREAAPRPSSSSSSNKLKAKNENVVDLKNLNRE